MKIKNKTNGTVIKDLVFEAVLHLSVLQTHPVPESSFSQYALSVGIGAQLLSTTKTRYQVFIRTLSIKVFITSTDSLHCFGTFGEDYQIK